MLAGRAVLLAVTGGVGAHYLPELVGQLRWRYLAAVQVVMTPAATHFVAPLTLAVASGSRVWTDPWEAAERAPLLHVQLARWAELVLVAPATANTLARIANGMADDLVTLIVLATRAPVVLAPAMHQEMWLSPAVQENVARLRARGYRFVGPERGLSTAGEPAEGRMASIATILAGLVRAGGEDAGLAETPAGSPDIRAAADES